MLEEIIDRFREPEQRKLGMEYCAVCHKKMDIPKDMPVGHRRNYYEGAGQICDGCWELIYGGGA